MSTREPGRAWPPAPLIFERYDLSDGRTMYFTCLIFLVIGLLAGEYGAAGSGGVR